MNLFQRGTFTLHSGRQASWKIDCDALSDADLEALAAIAVRGLPMFGWVEGIPLGGSRFADALRRYATEGCTRILIVDDVFTTGASMEFHRAGRRHCLGLVIFARGECPEWVWPMFRLGEAFDEIV